MEGSATQSASAKNTGVSPLRCAPVEMTKYGCDASGGFAAEDLVGEFGAEGEQDKEGGEGPSKSAKGEEEKILCVVV